MRKSDLISLNMNDIHVRVMNRRNEACELSKRRQPEGNSLADGRLAGGGALFVEKLPEDRIDVFLVADMLHGKVLKH